MFFSQNDKLTIPQFELTRSLSSSLKKKPLADKSNHQNVQRNEKSGSKLAANVKRIKRCKGILGIEPVKNQYFEQWISSLVSENEKSCPENVQKSCEFICKSPIPKIVTLDYEDLVEIRGEERRKTVSIRKLTQKK